MKSPENIIRFSCDKASVRSCHLPVLGGKLLLLCSGESTFILVNGGDNFLICFQRAYDYSNRLRVVYARSLHFPTQKYFG